MLCRAMQWEELPSKEKRDQEPEGVMQQWELTGSRSMEVGCGELRRYSGEGEAC